MPTPSLAQTQHLLWRLITAPSGVADGLQSLGDADGLLGGGLEAIINGDAVLPAVRRLDIYANMYFFRLLDAVKEDFPTVLAVVGADEFHNLITDYLLHHPPSHPSLREAGRHLPAFVSGHRLAEARPFLSDLARFEWALVEAFDSPDAPVVEPAALASVAPDAWPGLRLLLTPSLQLLQSEWVVSEPWRRVQDGEEPGTAPLRPSWFRTWRCELRVLHREIAADEFAALSSAIRGEPFSAMCEAIAEQTTESAAERAAHLLHQWLADGLLTGRTTQRA
ncbi:MAG TPA: DNA-binding domain-containing protein [Candidatus Kryptonia bacterium]|nr:DNA-binding domain-containing protein [Candidatus Kryptonia bacterium]